MSSTSRVKLMGMPGSPYTRKMLAVLRYRHIPYEFLIGMPGVHPVPGLPKPKVSLLPTFYLPNDDGELEAVVDSTPLISRFESEYQGRSVLPDDPVVRFINDLIEDYADEWLTKAMFHYRWWYQDDIDRAADILPLWMQLDMDDDQHQAMGKQFADRQIGRLPVVGSNETTKPIIEASYQRLLNCLNTMLYSQPYVMGQRPGSADFALYGQLTSLTHFDPTPMAEALRSAPKVFAWVDLMEDQSGTQPQPNDWWSRETLPKSIAALLSEIGRTYIPVLIANAEALATGSDSVEAVVDGQAWQQTPFPYQGKCLQWLRSSYTQLNADDRHTVAELLTGTGCEALWRDD